MKAMIGKILERLIGGFLEVLSAFLMKFITIANNQPSELKKSL